MANIDRQHEIRLAAELALQSGGKVSVNRIARDTLTLLRIGKQAHTLSVRECNGEGHWEAGRWDWNDKDEARANKRRATMLKNAQEIADAYGARVELGGDPRGYVLRLHFADAAANGWSEGWGAA